jgi:hypothetical protein
LCSPCGHCRCLLLLQSVFHASTFLPTFPRRGFAFRASRSSSPQQYYAGSDSCPALARQTGLFAYSALPSGHPAPNHVVHPEHRFLRHLSAFDRCPSTGPGFAPHPASSPLHAAESGSSSYGLSVRLRLLPTPPRGDAVTFSYMRCDLPWLRTYTLLAERTHERTGPARDSATVKAATPLRFASRPSSALRAPSPAKERGRRTSYQ